MKINYSSIVHYTRLSISFNPFGEIKHKLIIIVMMNRKNDIIFLSHIMQLLGIYTSTDTFKPMIKH